MNISWYLYKENKGKEFDVEVKGYKLYNITWKLNTDYPASH